VLINVFETCRTAATLAGFGGLSATTSSIFISVKYDPFFSDGLEKKFVWGEER
jgi:hypothetical protein